jgi:CheY-like chemotaxis protein
MAEVKRVLVVDDHFEMLDFLRSMLELSSQNYDVQAVPSAEEGLLELRQNHFDLLITDVRLAGMSGFDLIRRMQKFKPSVPVIMITAYSSSQGEREAAELGVHRYFRKPLDTDEVLAAVHTALYGGLVVHADSPVVPDDSLPPIPDEVARRLATLRSDTGAARLILSNITGQLLLQVGQGQGVNPPELTRLIAGNLDNSFELAEALGADSPATIQYHSGDKTELYIANVGRDYFLALLFDVQARRGRMGTIWVFAQRAIRDLLTMLPKPEIGESATAVEEAEQHAASAQLSMTREQPALPADATPISEKVASPGSSSEKTGEMAANQFEKNEEVGQPELLAPEEMDGYVTVDTGELDAAKAADTQWGIDLAESEATGVESGAISYERAQRKGLIPNNPDAEAEPITVNGDASPKASREEATALFELEESELKNQELLDDFWEQAAGEEAATLEGGEGLSIKEALRQGLIPPGFEKTPDAETAAPDSNERRSDPDPEEDNPSSRAGSPVAGDGVTESTDLDLLGDIDEDESVDLDAFWDSAVDTDNVRTDDLTNGFSYEEALRRGLISSEDEDDKADE